MQEVGEEKSNNGGIEWLIILIVGVVGFLLCSMVITDMVDIPEEYYIHIAIVVGLEHFLLLILSAFKYINIKNKTKA